MTPTEIAVSDYIRTAMSEAFRLGQNHLKGSIEDMFNDGAKAKTVSEHFQNYTDTVVRLLVSALESK